MIEVFLTFESMHFKYHYRNLFFNSYVEVETVGGYSFQPFARGLYKESSDSLRKYRKNK